MCQKPDELTHASATDTLCAVAALPAKYLKRWNQYTRPKELGGALAATAESLFKAQSSREVNARMLASLFEAIQIGSCDETSYFAEIATNAYTLNVGSEGVDLRWNLCRSISLACQAEIAGVEQPKCQVMTTGANWATKQRAKKLDRFVEGQWMMPQSGLKSGPSLSGRVFLDGEVFGEGVAEIVGDMLQGRVCVERLFHWDLAWDPQEAAHGNPKNLFRRRLMDVDELGLLYPDKQKEIEAAQTGDDGRPGIGDAPAKDEQIKKSVLVYEGWRLPYSSDKPGKWARALANGKLLETKPWERPRFPFERIIWQQHLFGYGGQGLCQEVRPLHGWINEQLQRFQEAEKLTGRAICLVPRGSNPGDQAGNNEEDFLSNEDATVVYYTPIDGRAVEYISPPSYNEASLQLLELNFGKAYELSGVNQLMASAQKPSGITANSAIRTVQNMQSRRFSVPQKSFEEWHMGVFEQMIWRAEEMHQAKAELKAQWAQGEFIEEIGFADVMLEDQPYTVQLAPVSGQKNSPADRLQTASELASEGTITSDAYLKMQLYFDNLTEMERHQKQERLIERYIESWLAAPIESLADDAEEPFEYRAPLKFMPRPIEALDQVVEAYMEAEIDGAPDVTLDLFRRFMNSLSDIIDERAAKEAALAQPPPEQMAAAAPVQ